MLKQNPDPIAPGNPRSLARGGFIKDRLFNLFQMVKAPKVTRVEIRLTPHLLSQIDARIEEGMAFTRSDYIYKLIVDDLAEAKIERSLKEKILELIKNDPDIIEEIRKV